MMRAKLQVGLDPVPAVPLAPFVPPLPTTDLGMPPAGLKRALPTDWHLGPLIYKGVQRYIAADAPNQGMRA